MLIKTIQSDKLKAHIFKSRDAMGKSAAKDCAEKIRALLKVQDTVNMIFAAAPSQSETLFHLAADKGIDWTKIRAFHMDEYIGLAEGAPQLFSNFLDNAIFKKLPFKEVHYVNGAGSSEQLIERYTALLKKYPADIVCLGIGENGHIAFNDPHIADFNDPALIKVVDLDERCRVQQVNDGCFASFDEVPTHALTLTIPALTRAKHLICTVPGPTKAEAVFNTVYGKIGEDCPATVMRSHADAAMYLDADSGRYVAFKKAVLSDEISQDMEIAAQLCKKHYLTGVEIRSVFDTPPEKLTGEQADKIKEVLEKYNLKAVAISSSLYKCNLGESEQQKLEMTAKVAKMFGCRFVRGFSYWKTPEFSVDGFAAHLKSIEGYLQENGLELLIEFDPGVNLTNGALVAELLKKTNSPAVNAIWDPGNDIYDEKKETPFPDGYFALKDYIKHVHVKDALFEGGKPKCVKIGTGLVDYEGQLRQLLKDGYDGYLVMETHYKIDRVIDEELMKRPGGSAFSSGGYEATDESLAALDEIILKVLKNY